MGLRTKCTYFARLEQMEHNKIKLSWDLTPKYSIKTQAVGELLAQALARLANWWARHVRFHISLALLCASVSTSSDVRDKKLLAHIKCDSDVGLLWVARLWSQRKAATPCRCSLSTAELPSQFSVAVQANSCVIIPTRCFGCGSSNIKTGAAQEAHAGTHPPYWSWT